MSNGRDTLDHIEWAMNTIRDRVMFGQPDLQAAYSRERRAKGALLAAKEEIERLKDKNKELAENVIVAENQNHYFNLMSKYKEENKALRATNKELCESLDILRDESKRDREALKKISERACEPCCMYADDALEDV